MTNLHVNETDPDPDETDPERAGWQTRPVLRHRAGVGVQGSDAVAEEVPLALVVNGISQVVMMATPRDLEAFALGFALTEGLVASPAQVYGVEARAHGDALEVELTVATESFQALKARRRTLAGRTGCGVCGIDSLAALDLDPEPIADARLPPDLAAAIARAAEELADHQALARATGGLHAASWCGLDGGTLAACEDVGRHNALDKLVGRLAREGVDLRAGFVFLSSRASYELVRKAARVGIPMLATISAPSTLAIDIAARAGIKLASFCRADGFTEYT